MTTVGVRAEPSAEPGAAAESAAAADPAAARAPRPAEPAYRYQATELHEPDWRRFPAWRNVTDEQWRDPRWQRGHSVKDVKSLYKVAGDLLDQDFYAEVQADQAGLATMPLLIPPHVLNTFSPGLEPEPESWRADPVRRYVLPLASERHPVWPSHPLAARDSLHESEMWAAEGLTHRYPTKAMAELVTTCPQYCGHCTRMDLVGTSTPSVAKQTFRLKRDDRWQSILDYLRATPGVRDLVVSGGDVANVPWPRLEWFIDQVLEIPSVLDIRLATKALVGLPQHWLDRAVREGVARLAAKAAKRGVALAVHTHTNAAQQVTPLVAEASLAMLEAGVRNVRNQGVLLAGVNDSPQALLDMCFDLLDHAQITPYYFYLCDIVPGVEHWRITLAEARRLQESIMGFLPGFATPRLVADVPFLGKRWVHQATGYDPETGISHWGGTAPADCAAGAVAGHYYDPIHLLPESGQRKWSAAWAR